MKYPAVTVLALLSATPALANDRAPTAAERATIESSLKAAGYVSWEDIELDDGRWEVDNARKADGSKFDLDLNASNYAVIRAERDWD